MNPSKEELSLVREWFNSVVDLNKAYLESRDYLLAEKIYSELGLAMASGDCDPQSDLTSSEAK